MSGDETTASCATTADLKELHFRILRELALADVPLKSRDLEARTGLERTHLLITCAWLFKNRFISRQIRLLRGRVGERPVRRRCAFWFITDKGREAILSPFLDGAIVTKARIPNEEAH